MTKLFDQAIETARTLPAAVQDDIAHAIFALAHASLPPEEIPNGHREAVLDGLRQADAGQFGTDEDVEKALRRFRE